MKRIALLLPLVLVLVPAVFGTNTAAIAPKDAPAPNLSTPEKAFRCAMRGFETADVELLKACLSRRLILDMCGDDQRPKSPEAYVKMWRECIQGAGGYQRPMLRVVFLPQQGADTGGVRRAHIKLKPVEGFQDFLLMVLEDGKWKFDER